MKRRLKTRILNRLNGIADYFVPSPAVSTPPARGVRYFVPIDAYELYCGKVSTFKEGRRYKKHIIARRTSYKGGLTQRYTYHFPKHWSEACIANRNLIKEAQRQAYALEHDHSAAALEWRLRFLSHYFRVFKGGAKPEPGMKPYSRFYQYVYVAIYRQLQAAKSKAEEATFEPISDNFETVEQPVWASVLRPRNYRPCRPIAKRSVGSPSRPLNDSLSSP